MRTYLSVAVCAAFSVRRSTIVFAFDILEMVFGRVASWFVVLCVDGRKKNHNILPDSLVRLFEAFFFRSPIFHHAFLGLHFMYIILKAFLGALCLYTLS